MVVFSLFQNPRYLNERSTKLQARIKAFRVEKWQNESSSKITSNRAFNLVKFQLIV